MSNRSSNLPWYLKGFWIFVIGIFTGGIYWIVGVAIRINRASRNRDYSPQHSSVQQANRFRPHIDISAFHSQQGKMSVLTKFGIIVSILWTLLVVVMHSSVSEEQRKDDGLVWGVMLILFWLILLIAKAVINGVKKLIDKAFMRDNVSANEAFTSTPAQPYVPYSVPTSESVPESPPEEPQLPAYDTMEGHDFEYYCADLLRKDGFSNVEVTRESGDQGIDILAEKSGIRYGIQCKCYSNNIGNSAVQQAFAGKTFYHCHIAAVLTNRYFTRSAKQLAEQNQVLLWDRDELKRLVQNAEN